MADSFHHGVRVIEASDGDVSITTIATAVIGLVATAPAADAATFPHDVPLLITDLSAAIGAAGDQGTLAPALHAISDQVSTPVIVVIVAPGANPAATDAAVIGTNVDGKRTGLQALIDAQSVLGLRPRIIGAPGLDTQPVAAALEVLLPKLRAFGYAAAIGANIAAVTTYRQQFSARELMLIWPEFTAFDVDSQSVEPAYAVARAMGLRAQIDQTLGWHKSISNVPVLGVTGITIPVHWDLQAAGSDSDLLNSAGVTTLINSSGYRFWGNRTCSADPDFVFESVTRTAQILADTVADAMLPPVDKPLNNMLARYLVDRLNAKFGLLVAQGYLLGARAYIDASTNTTDELKVGKLTIKYKYTPVPPLEDLTLVQEITDEYLATITAGTSS